MKQAAYEQTIRDTCWTNIVSALRYGNDNADDDDGDDDDDKKTTVFLGAIVTQRDNWNYMLKKILRYQCIFISFITDPMV